MTIHKAATGIVSFSMLAIFAIASPSPADAQTATDVKCRGCVGDKDIGKKAVKPKHLKPKAIKSKHIRDNAIQSQHIAPDAVDSTRIKDGTVEADDLAASAKPTGVDWADGDQDLDLVPGGTAVRTVVVSAPTAGYVTVMAAWHFYGSNPGIAICSLNTEIATDTAHAIIGERTTSDYLPGAAVRTFEVEAGENTFHLVCSVGAGEATVRDSSMSAIFTPARY